MRQTSDDAMRRRNAQFETLLNAAPIGVFLVHEVDGRLHLRDAKPAARATGTTVEVKELFFSTPARRKFLKTDATELAHCVEAVRRHALARPDVGFAIWHEGKLVDQWRAASPEQRIADVLGQDFVDESRPFAISAGPLALTGRAGLPEAAVHQVCEGGFLEPNIVKVTELMRVRCEAMVQGLAHMPEGTKCTPPEGGFFMWPILLLGILAAGVMIERYPVDTTQTSPLDCLVDLT